MLARRRFGAWQLCGPLCAWAAFAGGCNPEDVERMARLGHKVTAQAEALTADEDGGLNKSWQAVRNGWQVTTPLGRVAARLRWDKQLAEARIQVAVKGAGVELKGSVRDAEQKRRAVELAESTLGVDQVTDSLEVTAP